jgi:hypothetical protein
MAEAFPVLIEYFLDHSSSSFPSGGILDGGRDETFRMIRTTAIVLVALGIGTAALSLEDPLAPLAAVSASVIDVLAPMPDQATKLVTPAVALRMAWPTDGDAAIRLTSAAASEPADRHPAEAGEGAPDVLVKQFMAWAQSQDQEEQERLRALSQSPAEPVGPVEVAQEVSADDAMASVRGAEKPQRERAFRSARAELPPERNSQAKVSHAHPAPRAKPVENAHALDAPVRNAQPSSWSQMFGWHG